MKTIDIFIENKNVLLEKYNKKIISNELINYIINRTMYIQKQKKIQLNLHVTEETKNCKELIKNSIQEEYKKSIINCRIINIKQIILLLIGILILILSTLINENNILHEVIIIAGWVPIWESVDLELFTDTKEKQRKKALKKLIDSKITETKIQE